MSRLCHEECHDYITINGVTLLYDVLCQFYSDPFLRVQSDLFALAEMSHSSTLLNDLIKLKLGQHNNDNSKTPLA